MSTPFFFDAMDYGAVGDGITDDGPAVQSCGDAAIAAGGGDIFSSPESAFASPRRASGAARRRTSACTAPALSCNSTPRCCRAPSSRSAAPTRTIFKVEGITFVGPPSDWCCAELFYGSAQMVFNRCTFQNIGALDAAISNVFAGVDFRDCAFIGCSGDNAVVKASQPGFGVRMDRVIFNDTGDEYSRVGANSGPAILCDSPGGYNQGAPIHGIFMRELTFGEVLDPAIVINVASAPTFKWLNVVIVESCFQQQQQINSRSIVIDGAERVELRHNQYTWENAPERVGIEISNVDTLILDHERMDIQAPVDGHGGGCNKIIVHDTVKRVVVDESTYDTFLCDATIAHVTMVDGIKARLRKVAETNTVEANVLVKADASNDDHVVQLGTTDGVDKVVGVALEATAKATATLTFASAASVSTNHFFAIDDINGLVKTYEFIKDGSGSPVQPGSVVVAISTGDSSDTVAAAVSTAIGTTLQAFTRALVGGWFGLVGVDVDQDRRRG